MRKNAIEGFRVLCSPGFSMVSSTRVPSPGSLKSDAQRRIQRAPRDNVRLGAPAQVRRMLRTPSTQATGSGALRRRNATRKAARSRKPPRQINISFASVLILRIIEQSVWEHAQGASQEAERQVRPQGRTATARGEGSSEYGLSAESARRFAGVRLLREQALVQGQWSASVLRMSEASERLVRYDRSGSRRSSRGKPDRVVTDLFSVYPEWFRDVYSRTHTLITEEASRLPERFDQDTSELARLSDGSRIW